MMIMKMLLLVLRLNVLNVTNVWMLCDWDTNVYLKLLELLDKKVRFYDLYYINMRLKKTGLYKVGCGFQVSSLIF